MSLAYCFGAICGDGSAYIEKGKAYVLWFSSHNRLFADKVNGILKFAGFNPYLHYRFTKHESFCWIVKTKNKGLFEKYQNFRNTLNLETMSNKDALNFIKGFFDAEGFITENVASIVNTNRSLLEQIQNFLKKHGIQGNITRKQRAGEAVCVHGRNGVRRKDMWILNIYRDRREFAKLLCMEEVGSV